MTFQLLLILFLSSIPRGPQSQLRLTNKYIPPSPNDHQSTCKRSSHLVPQKLFFFSWWSSIAIIDRNYCCNQEETTLCENTRKLFNRDHLWITLHNKYRRRRLGFPLLDRRREPPPVSVLCPLIGGENRSRLLPGLLLALQQNVIT